MGFGRGLGRAPMEGGLPENRQVADDVSSGRNSIYHCVLVRKEGDGGRAMFHPDAHMPRTIRGMACVGVCLIAVSGWLGNDRLMWP